MAKAKRKRKNQLPSGNHRFQVYSHTEIGDDGKKHRIYESFTDENRDEAAFQAAEFKRERKRKKNPMNLTVSEAIDDYIAKRDAVLSPPTVAGYRKIKRNHFPSLMNMPLKELSNDTLQDAVNLEAKRPSKRYKAESKPLAPKTIANAYGLLVAVLNVYHPKLDTDVTLSAPQNIIPEILPAETVLEVVYGTAIELPAILAMWLSYSMSEIRGLTKSKSIKNGYITMREVVVDIDGKPLRKETGKAFYRIRRHKIPPYVQYLIDQTDPNKDQLVTMSGQAIYKRFVRLLAKRGLPHMTFHQLRHLNASVMALLSVPDKYAMARGGWKTDQVMKRVYQHTFNVEREAVDERVDTYFEEKVAVVLQNATRNATR